MTLRFPSALRATRADTITARAGNAARLRIYGGGRPSGADVAVTTQTLLAELTCGSPFAAPSVDGVLAVLAITQDSSADASGTARWFRLVQSNGTTVVMDGSVTGLGGGGDLELPSVAIIAGSPVGITSLVITEGGAV